MAGSTIIQLVLRARDEASGILNKTVAGLTAAFAAFKGAEAIGEAVNQMTQLDQAAKRLNLNMEDLTAAQYAAFKGARVESEQFVDALEEVTIKVKEFASINSGGAVDFFQIMKVDAQEFIKLDPLEQLMKISDVMKDMSGADKFTFLDQIGSDNLRNLYPLLKNGSAEFKELARQAKAAGLTLSDIDVTNISEMQKAVTDLKTAIGVDFKKSVASVAPDIQALVELMTSGFEESREAIKKTGVDANSSFETLYPTLNGILKLAGMVKDGFNVLFLGIKSTVLNVGGGISYVFDNIGKDAYNSFTDVLESAQRILGRLQSWIAGSFMGGLVTAFGKIPGAVASSMTEGLKNAQATLSAEANKNLNVKYERVQNTVSARTQELWDARDSTDAEAKALIRSIQAGDTSAKALTDAAEKFRQRREEIRKENEKLAKDRDQDRADELGGTAGKNNLTNTQTAATLAATQAKLQADLAKLQIDKTIERIQTQQQLDTRALEDRARAENLTANEIADARLQIDLKANREISDQRKASLGEDIKVLQAQLAAQRKVLGQSTIDSERGTALGAIADIEAQISVKKQEQVNLTAQLANQEALLKGERASALADAQAQIKALKEQLDVDLLRIRGNDYQADLKEIEREFEDTKRVLESLGEDSTAAKELVDARKAKAELMEIERQYDRLKEKLSKNQITQADFKAQSGKLIERGESSAGTTGNEEDLDRVSKMTEDAKSSVLSLDQLTGALGESMSSNFEDAFSGWISGSKSASEAMSEMATSVLADISKIIAKMLVQLAIQQMLSAFGYGGASGGSMGGALSGLSASVNHDGGVIGSGGGRSRTINPLMFTTPLYYHTGGIAGLAADEVPAVLQKGEEVLTKNDPRHRNNVGEGQESNPPQEQKITIVNQIESGAIVSAMDSAAGEKWFVTKLRENKALIA